MTRIILQPAASDQAQKNYRKCIQTPVHIEKIAEELEAKERQALKKRYLDESLYVWGITERGNGNPPAGWDDIEEGDVVVFTWAGELQTAASVAYKTDNERAARKLWGTDTEGRSWRYMYFLQEPEPVSIPYQEFNRAVGYSDNFVPMGFMVLDADKSRRALKELPQLNLPQNSSSPNPLLHQAFHLFRNDRLHRLTVRIRRHRAREIQELLSRDSIESEVFNREVWQVESASYLNGEEITLLNTLAECPKLEFVERVEEALESGGLEVHGNFHWTVATHVFGPQFDSVQRRESLEGALELLNRADLDALAKAKQLEEVPGFGQSTATGIVMLLHPSELAVFNAKSSSALTTKLGHSLSDLEGFQETAAKLKEELGASDFIELDWFLYQIAQDQIYIGQTPDEWPRVWWVNQGASYNEESTGGFVWAPTETKAGTTLAHLENVKRLQLGDRILHYANGALRAVGTVVGSPMVRNRPDELSSDEWQREGYYAGVEYDELETAIQLEDIPEAWRRSEVGGPFTKGGSVQQGYLFRLSDDFSRKVVAEFSEIQKRFPVRAEPPVQPRPEKDLAAIVSDFSAKLSEAHLTFGTAHEEVVRDFVVSLATKPLVILTGLSGSGKTQIALQFGRWLGEDRYEIVPVRPDWTGAEAMFGYPDALLPASDDGRRAWHVPAPLRFMLRAVHDRENPYLLILDEMNLAHVERYFADVISGMESGEGCLPNLSPEEDGHWRQPPDSERKAQLPFPDNLFIAGTVNVDETTYMFSPKVLDRANTMEFQVRSGDLTADLRKPGRCEPGAPELVRGFLAIAGDEGWQREHPLEDEDRFVGHLRDLHESLDEGSAFGHRVVYESLRFAALHQAAGGEGLEEALDVQVMQKILPRLHGSRRRLEPVLEAVGKFCYDLKPGAEDGGTPQGFDPVDHSRDEAVLPRSFDKVSRMMKRLRTNQFVSFTE